jgi:hypothetical protein
MVLVFLFALSLFFISAPTTAYAEEVWNEENGENLEATVEEAEAFDWDEWFKEKAMPVLVSAGAGLVAVCSFLYPVLHSVNGGIKLFKKTKGEFETVTQAVIETQTDITEFKQTAVNRIEVIASTLKGEIAALTTENKSEMENIKKRNTVVLEAYGAKLAELVAVVENLVKIAKIGFCNDKELVRNGYANEIMKVGTEGENGSAEIETSDSPIANI